MICSDKTGTLTKNEMTVTQLFTSDEQIAEVRIIPDLLLPSRLYFYSHYICYSITNIITILYCCCITYLNYIRRQDFCKKPRRLRRLA